MLFFKSTWKALLAAVSIFDSLRVVQSEVIHKDVVILGGGASGTYAAVRLREDYGKDILLVEMEPILGGHTNTFFIPGTDSAFNYGVQSYIDYLGAKAFFEVSFF